MQCSGKAKYETKIMNIENTLEGVGNYRKIARNIGNYVQKCISDYRQDYYNFSIIVIVDRHIPERRHIIIGLKGLFLFLNQWVLFFPTGKGRSPMTRIKHKCEVYFAYKFLQKCYDVFSKNQKLNFSLGGGWACVNLNEENVAT